MSFDDAYRALTDHDDDARWAYGTGFADPLAGVPTAVPDGLDRADLTAICLMLGDDALILSHRLQQWVTRAPELEDELAIANIALDLLGQARLLLSRAGEAEGAGRDEDALAYLRDAAQFRNVRLVEHADDDFAHLVVRLLVFSAWRLAVLDRVAGSRDPVLAAIAAKGVKEVAYHREYAAEWVVRLGDGTGESHRRVQAALDAVWPLVDELFRPHEVELRLDLDVAGLRPEFDGVMAQVLAAATLRRGADGSGADGRGAGGRGADGRGAGGVDRPAAAAAAEDARGGDAGADRGEDGGAGRGEDGGAGRGRDGVHTAALHEVLAELQSLARSLPGGAW